MVFLALWRSLNVNWLTWLLNRTQSGGPWFPSVVSSPKTQMSCILIFLLLELLVPSNQHCSHVTEPFPSSKAEIHIWSNDAEAEALQKLQVQTTATSLHKVIEMWMGGVRLNNVMESTLHVSCSRLYLTLQPFDDAVPFTVPKSWCLLCSGYSPACIGDALGWAGNTRCNRLPGGQVFAWFPRSGFTS